MVSPESLLVIWLEDAGFVDVAAHIWSLRPQSVIEVVCDFLGSGHGGWAAVVWVGDFRHW